MKYLSHIAAIFLVGTLITACSSSKNSKSEAPKGNSLVDVLTEFSIALNQNNFKDAVNYLSDEEKMRLMSGGALSEESKKQLKALRLHKLIKNPRIQLEGGKLVGIYNALPSLEHGQVEKLIPREETAEGSEPAPEDATSTEPEPEIESNQEQEEPTEMNSEEDLNALPDQDDGSEAAEIPEDGESDLSLTPEEPQEDLAE